MPGATIALVAPAGPVTEERIARARAQCVALGLEPVLLPAATRRTGYLAGTDDERLADLQAALDDPAIHAVWALRGGYGTLRLLDRIDFSRVRRRPKPYIGFSDNTAVLFALKAAGVVGFHGPHPGADFPPETEAAFRQVLFGGPPRPLPIRLIDPAPRSLRGGAAEGPIAGGNLAIVAALCGTRFSPDLRGHILFLEDVDEPVYRVDRLLTQLRLAGVLDGVAGLAFGRFTKLDAEDDPASLELMLRELADRLQVPAVVDLPIGHVEHNWTVPFGVRARLDADQATLTLCEAAVADGDAA